MEWGDEAGGHGLVQQLPHRSRVVRETEIRHQRRGEAASGPSAGGGGLAGAARGLSGLEKWGVAARRGGLHRRHQPTLQVAGGGRHQVPPRARRELWVVLGIGGKPETSSRIVGS